MSPVLLAVLAAVAVVAALLVVRRQRDPLVRRVLQFGEHRGLTRLSATEARERLAGFAEYLAEDRPVTVAVGGTRDGDDLVVGVFGSHDVTAVARPYVAAVVRADDLPDLSFDLDARSVRTVRVVRGHSEVDVSDPRLARGFRVTSSDPDRVADLLDADPIRTRFADVLHRPIPWVVAVRVRPAGVAVHLSRADETPADPDDFDRLARIAEGLADALRSHESGALT